MSKLVVFVERPLKKFAAPDYGAPATM